MSVKEEILEILYEHSYESKLSGYQRIGQDSFNSLTDRIYSLIEQKCIEQKEIDKKEFKPFGGTYHGSVVWRKIERAKLATDK